MLLLLLQLLYRCSSHIMNIVLLLFQLLTRDGVVLICRLLPISTAFLSYKLRLLGLSSFDVLNAQKFLQDLPSIGMV